MADAWLPTAGRMLAKADGGTMKGGAPRAVWLTNEADPRAVSARSVALALNREDRPAHLIWNPCLGDIVQMLPITLAGRQLAGEVGREGRACVQIMVIGSAQRPFTDGPLIGLESILNWLDIWSVPRRWPAGPPLPTPQSYHASRGRRAWARGGHFGCSQVPETTSPGPGGIDIRRITGPETPLVDIPRPRAIPVAETVLPPRLIRRPFEAVQGHGEESLVSSGLRATRVRPTA
ncbi:MAG TPA: hypothetical protein VF069_29540 [Streptosporangiaceae bacterium]